MFINNYIHCDFHIFILICTKKYYFYIEPYRAVQMAALQATTAFSS